MVFNWFCCKYNDSLDKILKEKFVFKKEKLEVVVEL